MPHPKQHITDLAEICHRKGIRWVVISPGSRCAPLIDTFNKTFGDTCVSIVDERSAAYFALGMAIYTQTTVVLICTSGTAVLNYAPAIAEAYYQQVSLLAITADRPHEWIDQQANQTIRQSGIYNNFIKGTYELPQIIASDDDLWYSHRIINEAINLSSSSASGPVQINVPLTEPLYDILPPSSEHIRVIHYEKPSITLNLPAELINEWKIARRIMIIHGQDIPDSDVVPQLLSLSRDGRIVILAENIANIPGKNIITNSNLLLADNRGTGPDYPDLILHSGGQVVSNALGAYLRRASNIKCWRIGNDNGIIDTFKHATRILPFSPAVVYRALLKINEKNPNSGYGERWLAAAANVNAFAEKTVGLMPFSDLRVYDRILSSVPSETLVMLGNSSVIRYAQLFTPEDTLRYYSNRGVSGIDGCISTAAGMAYASKKLTVCISGDLGFLYDSNALWNRELPANLRIVVINNGGGGIFHILKGPSEHPGFKKYVEANHPVNIHKLAEAFGLDYFYAEDETAVENQWKKFMGDIKRAAVFEIKTDASISASSFRQMMNNPL